MKSIVLTGGGTAGHVYPALAVAENLTNCELHYIGGDGIEKEILSGYKKITYHTIPTVKFERKFTMRNLLIPFKLAKSIRCCRKILSEISPDVIFSKGGFVSVPVCLAGKLENIKIVSHESDLSWGLANKIILHCCDVMCTTFKETASSRKKCVHTGQPIRAKIFAGKKQNFFDNNLPTILVLGGSLGATFLNNLVYKNLDALTKDYNILHICGAKNYSPKTHKNYKLVPYANNIEDFYATCDIVIARSGSGVINELLALSLPMLLVPLSKKSSRGDQIENARLFERQGYAQVLEEKNCSYNAIKNKINYLIKNKEKIQNKMKKHAKTDAAFNISKILLEI
jgi:UDP-N-acetylglucosamine--N-acetylmuramyl-(pentapeptide) pyrophosphoryl-undecaprenol N-acetylglucosamine transferase